jgi:hypothetical protein
MSTKTVYSIRLPVKYRKIMEDRKDVNWQEEIREAAIELINKKNKKKLLEDAREIRKHLEKDVKSAFLIREDRDAR